jgi:hypothetical protein
VKIGTKSILFGAHCILVHPLMMALAWWCLYGFPVDPRLWLAFLLHDIGYIGKPNMDGPEGKEHPVLGAWIIGKLFGPEWHDLCLYHSRHTAAQADRTFSRLCVADKLAVAITPAALYLPFVALTGELTEYMGMAEEYSTRRRPGQLTIRTDAAAHWFADIQTHHRQWAMQHWLDVRVPFETADGEGVRTCGK